ncbi:MAG: hypothetical protein ACRDVC_07475, partial [Acidimicrobiales bacterium]
MKKSGGLSSRLVLIVGVALTLVVTFSATITASGSSTTTTTSPTGSSTTTTTTTATAPTTTTTTTTTLPTTILGPNGVESSAIIAENRLPGTTSWKISGTVSPTLIQGFASLTYAKQGQ